MGRRRPNDRSTRRFDGGVAAGDGLDEQRTWVVWGTGADPAEPTRAATADDEEPLGRPGDDIARSVASTSDPEWRPADVDDAWVVLLDADESDVDAWATDDARVRGYAPYLLQPADPATEPMDGTLRPDRVVRRSGGQRIDAGRPR